MPQNTIAKLKQSLLKAYQNKQYSQCLVLFEQIINQGYSGEDVLNLAAMAHFYLGHQDKALKLGRRALSMAPTNVHILNNLGAIFLAAEDWPQAENYLARALRQQPNNLMALFNLAQAKAQNGDLEGAVQALELALKLQPYNPRLQFRKGIIHAQYGQREAAAKAFAAAVRAEPYFGAAWYEWVKATAADTSNRQLVAGLDKALQTAALDDPRLAQLAFAKADILHNSGYHERAFKWYRKANRISNVKFDAEALRQDVKQRKVSLPPFEIPRDQYSEKRLVFLVGMPRSGTTLLEQMLSVHQDVFPAGESLGMAEVEQQLGSRIDDVSLPEESAPELLLAARERYLNKLPVAALEAPVVTDKQPLNLFRLGLIKILFPNALFIHCLRHPLDTILSCYTQSFERRLNFTFDLDAISETYMQSLHMMRHWYQEFDQDIFLLRYEQLVAEPETVMRAVLTHCALDWDPAVLQPERNSAAVRTASEWQVREPLHGNAVERWRHYAEPLQPVIAGLREQGVLDEANQFIYPLGAD